MTGTINHSTDIHANNAMNSWNLAANDFSGIEINKEKSLFARIKSIIMTALKPTKKIPLYENVSLSTKSVRDDIKISDSINLCQYTYTANYDDNLLKNKTLSLDIMKKLANVMKLEYVGNTAILQDPATGLVASVLVDDHQNEIHINFSGMGGGLSLRSFEGKLINGKPGRFKFKQFCGCAKNLLSNKTPDIYKKAALLTEELMKLTEYKICLSGHSMGGSLASYAAIMNSTREKKIEARCFASLGLGSGAQKDLLRKHKTWENVKQNQAVQHHIVKGDPVPKMQMLFQSITHVGKIFTYPQVIITNRRNYKNVHNCHKVHILAALSHKKPVR